MMFNLMMECVLERVRNVVCLKIILELKRVDAFYKNIVTTMGFTKHKKIYLFVLMFHAKIIPEEIV